MQKFPSSKFLKINLISENTPKPSAGIPSSHYRDNLGLLSAMEAKKLFAKQENEEEILETEEQNCSKKLS